MKLLALSHLPSLMLHLYWLYSAVRYRVRSSIAAMLCPLYVYKNLGAYLCKSLVLCWVATTRPWRGDVLRATVASRVLKHHGARSKMKGIEVFCNCDNEWKLVMLVEFTICWKKITGNNTTMSLATRSPAWELLQAEHGKQLTFWITCLQD